MLAGDFILLLAVQSNPKCIIFDMIKLMKMKFTNIAALVVLALLGISCVQQQKPKVIYSEPSTSSSVDQEPSVPVIEEPQEIRIADLPVVMGGSNYLIHPVGEVRVYNSTAKYGGSKSSRVSYAISSYVPYELTGYLENLMFQHKDSLQIRALTNQKLQIQSGSYIEVKKDKTTKSYLIYNVFDRDTNRDGHIDSGDIRSLYISYSDGRNFKKLSAELQELVDWNFIEAQNRLYYRSIEDINKNGAFDENDNMNYFYVDLMDPELTIMSYNPLEQLKGSTQEQQNEESEDKEQKPTLVLPF